MTGILTSILVFFLGFIVQALALKVSLSIVGQAKAQNKFSKALWVSLILSFALLITGFIPVVGWIAKPLVWLLIVMSAYNIGFTKSVGVAVLQALAQHAMAWLLKLIGLSAFAQAMII